MGIGEYPDGYEPRIHGPYDPARYYGPKDTPFGEVRLKDLGAWFLRRKYTPQAITGAISRAYWRWQHKYVLPRKSGAAAFFQVVITAGIVFYVMNFDKIRRERRYEHHW